MYVKMHIRRENTVVAIADKELIGKKFEEGKLQLEVTESFYKGELKSEKEVLAILEEATNLNIVGAKIINLALKQNIIQEENILRIQNTPHACIFSV